MTKVKHQTVPTRAELELLKVLWKHGPATVRQVHESNDKNQLGAYTTTLKVLQIMYEKGLVERDASTRAHIYQAINSKAQTQQSFVKEMLAKVFGGSKFELVMRALGDAASTEEIAEIRLLLDSLENNKK
jgi:BlaI family penicillinase repressor